jgi:hypothetical protein
MNGAAHMPLEREEESNGPDFAAAEDPESLSEQRFWRWTTVGLGALAIGKGIREPNSWSYTQAQFDYSEGFMRRGLFGAAFGRLLELNRYQHFVIVSTALLLLLFTVLALLAYKSKLAEWTPPGQMLAVYASSYSVSLLAHLNGYMDIPLALLCALPLFVRGTGPRVAAAALATVLGALIHEQFLFSFLPVLVVSVLFGDAAAATLRQRRLAWAGAGALLLLGLAMGGLLARHGSISQERAAQLSQAITARTDQPVNTEVLKTLPRTAHENAEIMRSVWARPTFIPAQIESLLMFGPTAGVLSWGMLLVLRRWAPRDHRRLYALTLVGMLAPLSLNLVGWDKNRWNEMLSLNAFLLLLAASRVLGGERVQLPVRFRRACVLVMLLNVATGGGMFDNRHIRPFPFLRSPDAAATYAASP